MISCIEFGLHFSRCITYVQQVYEAAWYASNGIGNSEMQAELTVNSYIFYVRYESYTSLSFHGTGSRVTHVLPGLYGRL